MDIYPIERATPQEIAHIFVSSWKVGYRGLLSDDYLDNIKEEELVSKWQDWLKIVQPGFVAYKDNAAIGFISCGKIRTRPPGDKGIVPLYAAETYALYIHPDYFRQGIGKTLMKTAMENLLNNKINSMVLWVLKNNKRALNFYESLGGQRIGKVKKDIGGMMVEESAIGWRDVSVILDKLSKINSG